MQVSIRLSGTCPLPELRLTQTCKRQHCQIQFEQEVSFLRRFAQRIPDVALPFSFQLRIDDFDGMLLDLDFLVLEFGHLQDQGARQA